ncbi:MAG: potassium transporter TrkG [Bacteroidota bacterium]
MFNLPTEGFRLRPPQILVLGFAAVILIGALILTLPIASNSGTGLRFLDALFTSTSAVCVNGLIVVDTATHTKTMGPLSPGGMLSALFQSITPRTAGYNTLNIGAMRLGTLFLLVMLMFIGASPSSTGGGIKTTTFGVLLATIIVTIRGYDDIPLAKRRLPKDLVYKSLTIATWGLRLESVRA